MTAAKEGPAWQGRLRARYVYIDACVYLALQFDWNGRWLSALVDLANRGMLQVVVTDITMREVQSLMREVCAEASKDVQKHRSVLRQLGLGDAVKTVADVEGCVARMNDGFLHWLRRTRAVTVEITQDAAPILDDYFGRKPPFGPGKKKWEFPDAFVVSALRAWCSEVGASTYVISTDGDLKACCSPGGPLIHAASIAEVVSHDVATAAVHDAVTAALTGDRRVNIELQQQARGLRLDVEDGPGRATVTADAVKLEDVTDRNVFVVDFDGTKISCEVDMEAEISFQAAIEPDLARHGRHRQPHEGHRAEWFCVNAKLTAAVQGHIVHYAPLSVQIDSITLHRLPIVIPWEAVAWPPR